MKILALLLAVLLCISCHPLVFFRPPLPQNSLKDRSFANIKIAINSYGIPFIKAPNLSGAMYGLGFMHARDRLFHLDLMRHAALGRLTELFGKKAFYLDKKHRLLSYRLDDQMNNLSEEEHKLLRAYVRGVNESARSYKKSAEHFFLGADFAEFTERDAIAIARFQAWQLGSDLMTELLRLGIMRSNASMDKKAEFSQSIEDHNSAIIRKNYKEAQSETILWPAYLGADEVLKKEQQISMVEETGASNAWAVHASLMDDKHAVLMNDPHLLHTWPSNFYLATIEAGDLKASGASFVGLPAVLIGSSPHVSWGVTASYANTQDSVKLLMDKTDKKSYWVDGKKYKLEPKIERFCLDKKGTCFDETSYLSIFGPVIDNNYDPVIEKNDMFAVMWTGFLVEEHKNLATSFAELLKAKSVHEATEVVLGITMPGVNLVLADTKGDIAYAYAGLIPKRDETQNAFLPLDGAKSTSKWAGVLAKQEKPHVVNPPEGIIINANQNIFSHAATNKDQYGQNGAPPYRAMRIRENIESMLAFNKALSFDDLSSIQLDDLSIEAREIAPVLGRLCEEQFGETTYQRKVFVKKLASFDGRYSTSSLAALPFDIMMRHIIKQKLKEFTPKDSFNLPYNLTIKYMISNALIKEIRGQKTALFNDSANPWQDQVQNACEGAYQELIKTAGKAPWKWRYGRHHYLYRQSPLGRAPLLGTFFRDRKREVGGTYAAPLAEGGVPVKAGANLRLQVKMSSPPLVHMVIDSGNSGTPGHKNTFDQAKLWHKGKTIAIKTSWPLAKKKAKLYFELNGQ